MTSSPGAKDAPLYIGGSTSKDGEKNLDCRKESANTTKINRRKRTVLFPNTSHTLQESR